MIEIGRKFYTLLQFVRIVFCSHNNENIKLKKL